MSRGLQVIGWNFAAIEVVNHGKKEYVRGDAHTNTVEGYFSILKRGIVRHLPACQRAALPLFGEFDFRYSNREKLASMT